MVLGAAGWLVVAPLLAGWLAGWLVGGLLSSSSLISTFKNLKLIFQRKSEEIQKKVEALNSSNRTMTKVVAI